MTAFRTTSQTDMLTSTAAAAETTTTMLEQTTSTMPTSTMTSSPLASTSHYVSRALTSGLLGATPISNPATTTAETSNEPPWKWLTYGTGGLALVAIVIVIALAIYLCRVKGVLRKAATTMYSLSSASDDPEYKDPGRRNKGGAVQLKQFTVHSEHYEDEIDSPTFSPTPPPLRTIPPKSKVEESEAAPSIVPRPKKMQLQTRDKPAPKVKNDTEALLPTATNNTAVITSGIRNPAFEADNLMSNSAKPVIDGDGQSENGTDDIYEEYAKEYENTKENSAVNPQGVFSQDTGNNDDEDDGDYEEPFKLLNERSMTGTQEYLERQTSVSGLPDMKLKKTHSAESPLKLLSTNHSDDDSADDSENVQTIDDLDEYDEVTFADSTGQQASTRSSSTEFNSERSGDNTTNIRNITSGDEDDGESYENVNNPLSAQYDMSPESSTYGNQSFDTGMPPELCNSEQVDDSQMTVAQFPDGTQADYTGSESDGDDSVNYENSDMLNSLHAQPLVSGLPSMETSSGFSPQGQMQTDTHQETIDTEFDSPPPLPDSPPPLPNSPPPLPTLPPPTFGDPPFSPSEPNSFPTVPPRRDLVAKSDDTSDAGLPSAQVPSINIGTNLAEIVERRKTSASDASSPRGGTGPRVGMLKPRNSYFMYRDDKTQVFREDSQEIKDGLTLDIKDLLKASRRPNGSPAGFQFQADDDNDNGNNDNDIYDSPPPTMYNY